MYATLLRDIRAISPILEASGVHDRTTSKAAAVGIYAIVKSAIAGFEKDVATASIPRVCRCCCHGTTRNPKHRNARSMVSCYSGWLYQPELIAAVRRVVLHRSAKRRTLDSTLESRIAEGCALQYSHELGDFTVRKSSHQIESTHE
jgi:hypothetical protein